MILFLALHIYTRPKDYWPSPKIDAGLNLDSYWFIYAEGPITEYPPIVRRATKSMLVSWHSHVPSLEVTQLAIIVLV